MDNDGGNPIWTSAVLIQCNIRIEDKFMMGLIIPRDAERIHLALSKFALSPSA